jgi:hypothetical protein
MRRCKAAARDHDCTKGCAPTRLPNLPPRAGPLHIVAVVAAVSAPPTETLDGEIVATERQLVIMPALEGSLPTRVQNLRPRAGPLHIVAVVAAVSPPGRGSLGPLPTESSTVRILSRQGPRTVEMMA